jgi:hypothetical protein
MTDNGKRNQKKLQKRTGENELLDDVAQLDRWIEFPSFDQTDGVCWLGCD